MDFNISSLEEKKRILFMMDHITKKEPNKQQLYVLKFICILMKINILPA